MYRINRAILVALFVAVGAFAGIVSAQDQTFPATQTQAAINNLPLIAAPEIEVLEVTPEAEAPLVINNIEAPTPAVEATPTDTGGLSSREWVLVAVIAALLVAVTFGANVLFKHQANLVQLVADATPPWLDEIIRENVRSGAGKLSVEVEKTPNTIDDDFYARLEPRFFDTLETFLTGKGLILVPANTMVNAPSSATINVPAGSAITALPLVPVTTPGGSPLPNYPVAPSAADAERIARERQQAGANAVAEGYDANSEAAG